MGSLQQSKGQIPQLILLKVFRIQALSIMNLIAEDERIFLINNLR